MLLYPDALPWFMAAFLHCGQVGIGEPRARFTVDPSGPPVLVLLEDILYAADQFSGMNQCVISFKSPFILEDNGERLEELDFSRLIKAVVERLQPNVGYWSGAWMKNKERDGVIQRLVSDCGGVASTFINGKRVAQVSRKYNGRESSLLGFTGDMVVSGNLYQFMSLLISGSLLHIGQQVSLDRGRYAIYSVTDGKAESIRLFDLFRWMKTPKE